ncbi:hypothetical protein Vretimale_18451 [Volvox reticuliferus]|nr:hypothetical protein Vretimale_18451 [Volvox reticuliferus]
MGARLLANGLARRGAVEYILHARVPIVKFVEPNTGIEVDLCLGNDSTAFKAWSVAQMASIHPAFGKLFRVVKVWAKAHSINDGASHMLNSWCLTLVVISFLQTYPDPPLLPPLHELLYDNVPDMFTPRLMQDGKEPSHLVYSVMESRVKLAQEVYGSRPCKSVDELFRDFVEDGARKLRSLLAREGSFLRDTRVSAFYGKMLSSQPFSSSYVLCVEDPYDDTDNTARTLGTWECNPGTVHYITSVFERTLRHLDRHVANAATAAASGSGQNTCGDDQVQSYASCSTPSSVSPSSLGPTLAFLFGTELLTWLPELSGELLGTNLCSWARMALGAGRPAGEVHEEMLRQLGAANEFVSFESFKRRHSIKVHNEAKYATPEEKAAAAAADAARKAAKSAKKAQKRATKKVKEVAEQAARNRELRSHEASGHLPDAPHQVGGYCSAEEAVNAALRGKQEQAGNSSRPPLGDSQRKQRPIATGANPDRAPLVPLAAKAEPLLPPPSPLPPQEPPRRRLAPDARAMLAKALRLKPEAGLSSEDGKEPRQASWQMSADGAAAAATEVAAYAASRRVAREAGAGTRAAAQAAERTLGSGDTSASGRGPDAAALAAAAALAVTRPGTVGSRRQQGEHLQSRNAPMQERSELEEMQELRRLESGSNTTSTGDMVVLSAVQRLVPPSQEGAKVTKGTWKQQQTATGVDSDTQSTRGGRQDGGRVHTARRAERRRVRHQRSIASAHTEEAQVPP